MSDELRRIQNKLDEQTIIEVDKLLQNPNLQSADRLHYVKLIAFYVILTSCENGEGAENKRPEFSNTSWLKVHQDLIRLFDEQADAIAMSKSNFKRPLLRRNQNGTQELSGVSGDDKSVRLWRMEESGVSSQVCDPSSGTNFTAVEVPKEYEIGSRSALLFIVLNDIVDLFLSSQFTAVEIPCLVLMFLHSSANNRKNFPALIGEYVSLVKLCIYEGFVGPLSSYCCHTKRYDFAIKTVDRKMKVSVKSVCFEGSRLFALGQSPTPSLWKEADEIKFVTGTGEVNILIHNCDCNYCAQNQVRQTEIKNGCITNAVCSNTGTAASSNKEAASSAACGCCSRINDFNNIVRHVIKGTVYFIRVDMVFELRYAFETFDHVKFRQQTNIPPAGAPTRNRNRGLFNLRDFFVWSLDPSRKYGNEISDDLQTLTDRQSN